MGMVIDRAAKMFEAPPVATFRLSHRVPPGFHGHWFGDVGAAWNIIRRMKMLGEAKPSALSARPSAQTMRSQNQLIARPAPAARAQ